LQPSTLVVIQERTSKLMERANARVLLQHSLPSVPPSPKTARILHDAAFRNRQTKRLPPVAKLQQT
jgi:hypothetical protein